MNLEVECLDLVAANVVETGRVGLAEVLVVPHALSVLLALLAENLI